MKNQSPRQRLQQIIGVLAKYGLKQGVANPAALRRALEELGPTFVKIAQILSTRPDILPEPWREELAKLQDDVRPEPFDVIRATVEAELGGELGNFFAFFSPQPMASASIAQVHLARLLDGSPVVVKVKRPDIEQMIFNDLKLLKQLARLGRFFPQTSVWNPADVADELQQALELELDFQHEADNIRRFRLGHAGIRYIAIPRVYPRFSGRHVLVMEYIRGIKVSDRAALIAAGYDPEEICAKIVCNFMHQVLDLGFFHADLHPGNVLISANKIAYLDFGLVGNLSPRMKKHFGNLLTGIVEGDPEKIVASIIHMGIKKGRLERSLLYTEIEHLYNNYISASICDLDIPHLTEEIFRICRQSRLAFPRDIALFIKGVLVLEGLVHSLAPDMELVELMAPYIRSRFLGARSIRQELRQYAGSLQRATRSGLRIPDKLLEVLNKLAAGRAVLQLEARHWQEATADFKKSVNRVVFAMIASALIIGSSLVIAVDAGPKVFSISILGLAGYLSAAVMGLWLLISILRSGKI